MDFPAGSLNSVKGQIQLDLLKQNLIENINFTAASNAGYFIKIPVDQSPSLEI